LKGKFYCIEFNLFEKKIVLKFEGKRIIKVKSSFVSKRILFQCAKEKGFRFFFLFYKRKNFCRKEQSLFEK